MGVLNFFKKKKEDDQEKKGMDLGEVLDKIDTSGMTTMQKMALGIFKKLPKGKQEETLRKAFNPQTIFKEKDKIIKQLNEAVKTGQMSKLEAQQIKNYLGWR